MDLEDRDNLLATTTLSEDSCRYSHFLPPAIFIRPAENYMSLLKSRLLGFLLLVRVDSILMVTLRPGLGI